MEEIQLIFKAIQEGISHTEKKIRETDSNSLFSLRDRTIAQIAASKAIHFYTKNIDMN